jgi:uncharacterized membrane protein (DUF485 family)
LLTFFIYLASLLLLLTFLLLLASPFVADVSVDAGVPASVGALLILGYPAVGSFFIIA